MPRQFINAFVMLLWALLPCAAAPCFGTELGVGIHPTPNIQFTANTLAENGLSFRTDVKWSAVEAERGVLTFPASLAYVDSLATAVADSGSSALLILDYGNKFYGGGDGGTEEPVSPAAIQAFANYARFVAAHFKDRVTRFEIYNEWNVNITSVVQPHAWGNAAVYATLLHAAHDAIKSVNPKAVVIGGVVAGTDTGWIDRFIATGGLAYLDALSVHPYVYKHAVQPEPPSGLKLSWIAAAGAADAVPPGTPEEAIAWIDSIKASLDQAAPGRNIPMYVSEIGWPTYIGQYGVPEAVAAAYLERFLLLAHVRPWLAGVWWYDLIDGGLDATNPEDRFGLLHSNGALKPAFSSLSQISNFFKSSAQATQQVNNNGITLITGQDINANTVCAAWLPINDFAASRPVSALTSPVSPACNFGSAATVLTAVPVLHTK